MGNIWALGPIWPISQRLVGVGKGQEFSAMKRSGAHDLGTRIFQGSVGKSLKMRNIWRARQDSNL